MKCKDICGFMVSVMDLFFLVDFWVVITYGVLVTKLCVAAWDVGLLLEERWLSPDEIGDCHKSKWLLQYRIDLY